MSDAVLILAQIDDASGELLGRVLEQLTDLGAKNVQLLANVGKKGRPGYTLLVDIPGDAEQEVAPACWTPRKRLWVRRAVWPEDARWIDEAESN